MKIEKEIENYRKYTSKAEINKAMNLLDGLLTGLSIDKEINKLEIEELNSWCEKYLICIKKHPYNELIPFIRSITEDGLITEDEKHDLKWVINQILSENQYYDVITNDIQKLMGIIHGILADNIITDEEILLLKNWLLDNEHLVGIYPFDELESLLVGIMEDGVITEKERAYLKVFIAQFIDSNETKNINIEEIERLKKEITITGICTINPNIEFHEREFCFTGISKNMSREEFANKIISLGGLYNNNVTKKTSYLIVGNEVNPCWAYSCYGRKVEKAIELRKTGNRISIVSEIDYIDSIIE